MSIITSFTEAVRTGTNDWCNSSDAAKTADAQKTSPVIAIDLIHINVLRKAHHKSAARIAYSMR
jgi:hypothetical protein